MRAAAQHSMGKAGIVFLLACSTLWIVKANTVGPITDSSLSDEFVGPFSDWLNVKDFGAQGKNVFYLLILPRCELDEENKITIQAKEN